MNSPPVTGPALNLSVQSLWREWLLSYFDGGTHYLDGSGVVFPNLSVEPGEVERINFDVADEAPPTSISVLANTNMPRVYLAEHGQLYFDPVAWSFFVRSKIGQSGAGNSRYQCRQIMQLLRGLLYDTEATRLLAQKGIMNLQIQDETMLPETAWATRILRVRGELHYQMDQTARILGRYIWYRGSAFDTVNSEDAIATDKTALLPDHTATFANYTSYAKGINGLMIDVMGLIGLPDARDFRFRIGNDLNPAAWAAAPDPIITISALAGLNKSARIILAWTDGAIKKTWLQVTMLATPRTGLAGDDVFYFGNAVGEVGNADDALVDVQDINIIEANYTDEALISSAYDINRDGVVDSLDADIARNNQTSPLTALRLISV